MRPFFVVRRNVPQNQLWTREREEWSQNDKLFFGNQKKPDFAISPGRKPGEPVLFVIGMGEMYREELSELAERVRENGRINKPNPGLVDLIREAFEERLRRHRKNPITDPAPDYTKQNRRLY